MQLSTLDSVSPRSLTLAGDVFAAPHLRDAHVAVQPRRPPVGKVLRLQRPSEHLNPGQHAAHVSTLQFFSIVFGSYGGGGVGVHARRGGAEGADMLYEPPPPPGRMMPLHCMCGGFRSRLRSCTTLSSEVHASNTVEGPAGVKVVVGFAPPGMAYANTKRYTAATKRRYA